MPLITIGVKIGRARILAVVKIFPLVKRKSMTTCKFDPFYFGELTVFSAALK